MATLQELEAGLQKAHAAGNAEHARAFANAIRQMRSAPSQSGVTRSAQEWADIEGLPVPGTEWNAPERPERFVSPIPGGEFMNQMAGAFASNVPIIGPLVDRGADAVGSQIASMISGQTPEQARADAQYIQSQQQREQPVADALGMAAGAAGPLMRLAQTPGGSRALGTEGPMWQRMLFGAGSGGAIAGADSLARGNNLEDAAWDAAAGVGIGAASPVAERVISPVARALFGGTNPSAAERSVAQSLENAQINPSSIPQMMDELGPDAMLLDLNRNLQRQGGGIASVPGQGSTILDDALTARSAGTNARIQGEIDSLLGVAPVPSRLAAEISENQRALSPLYENALEGAKAVDTADLALTLDSMIVNERGAAQNAARQIRQMLNVVGTDQLDPNPRTLLNVRRAIDGILYTDGAMAPIDSNMARILNSARREIDAELAAKVPGIKDVDRQFAELSAQRGGVETGQTALSSGRNEAIRPSEMVDMLTGEATNIVGPSGVPFRISQGTRAEIDRLIGTTGNDITALKQALRGDGSWNREKLSSLFGKDRADQLVNLLEREQRYASSFNRITQNSETAARQAAQREAMPAEANFDIQRLLFGLPEGIANAAARSRSQSVNAQIAELLASRPSPEMIDRLIAARVANRGVLGSAGVPVFVGIE